MPEFVPLANPLADAGEDLLAYCPDSDYAANVELATYIPAPSETNYSGAFLAGDQAACTAACNAFRDAVVQIAGAPLGNGPANRPGASKP